MQGLHQKYYVARVDGKDAPGGPKENARYFVLDYINDPIAKVALREYALRCKDEYPQLADDLLKELSECSD